MGLNTLELFKRAYHRSKGRMPRFVHDISEIENEKAWRVMKLTYNILGLFSKIKYRDVQYFRRILYFRLKDLIQELGRIKKRA